MTTEVKDPKHAHLCELGEALSNNWEQYAYVRHATGEAFRSWDKRRTGRSFEAYCGANRVVADAIGFQAEYRSSRQLADDLYKVVRISERYVARRKLAEAAGVALFEVGMRVLYNTGPHWISGTVEKLHPDGKFTFHAYEQKPVILDPTSKVTVEVIRYA